jgi:DNA-binding transcriptional LysR family regulator
VAETGSLSSASEALGLTQPTVGRQNKALEAELSARLFDRHARGLHLTQFGHALLPAARQMRDAAGALSLALAGQDAAPTGSVRITASVFTANFLMPALIATLRQTHPGIEVELVATDKVENLLFREADITVRMVRPEQLDMVTRHVGDLEMGLFAARSYIDRHGVPIRGKDLLGHDLVGYDRNDLILRGFRAFGYELKPSDFAVRCDNQSAYWQLVRAGCGIGASQTHVGAADPNVIRVLADLPIPALRIRLTTHPGLRATPRVSAVWDALDQHLSAMCKSAPP